MERKTSILWGKGIPKIAHTASEVERALSQGKPPKRDNLLEGQDEHAEQTGEELSQREIRFQDIGAQALDRTTEIIPSLKATSPKDC